MSEPLGKKEQRRLARQARKEQQAARRRQERRRNMAILASIIVVVVGAISWGVWAATRPKPGVGFSIQGRDHIAVGQPHPPYNSNPPTSGWHYDAPATWGFYATELPDEALVHNLEHGGIWISYKDPNDADVIDKLTALSRRFPKKVIITLRSRNDSRLAVAAWGRLLKLDGYDEKQLVRFISTFKDKGPERVFD